MILALILPVATATVERAFLAMNIIKNRLRNQIRDQWMNDCLVTYINRRVTVQFLGLLLSRPDEGDIHSIQVGKGLASPHVLFCSRFLNMLGD